MVVRVTAAAAGRGLGAVRRAASHWARGGERGGERGEEAEGRRLLLGGGGGGGGSGHGEERPRWPALVGRA